ncbi:hypothetical protein NDU88_002929 [Pleurodeles waltl]|uniref:Uncharacterized protein n=1 Tax=Pleurodeles waltl TaxID=8319 RepID=A0AAV7Q8C9_PLEWA|nr:hypothetical protein NDU88_002929 [Pleurodeles waltl]
MGRETAGRLRGKKEGTSFLCSSPGQPAPSSLMFQHRRQTLIRSDASNISPKLANMRLGVPPGDVTRSEFEKELSACRPYV